MNMDQLKALRAEVLRAQGLASRKVSRLERVKGVAIAGTRLDPRREGARVQSYTAKQLQTYLGELNTFRSRKVQYSAGARGGVVSAAKWQEYKRLERRFNKKAERANRLVRDLKIVTHGMTVAERDALLRPKGPSARGVVRPTDKINRRIGGIASDKALDKLIADMRVKTGRGYESETLARQRKVSRKMANGRGNKRVRDRLSNLTADQFNALWNYTDFPDQMATKYHTNADSDSRFVAQTRNSADSEIERYLDWAESINLDDAREQRRADETRKKK